MKGKLLIAALLGALLLPMVSFGATYYAHVTVYSTGNGSIYVTKSSGVDIGSITDWKTDDDDTYPSRSGEGDVAAYAYAKPDSGYAFDGWYAEEDCSTLKSKDNPWTATVNAGARIEALAKNQKFYAKFVKSEHVCTLVYEINGNTITRRCSSPDCDKGGRHATLTLSGLDLTYSAQPQGAAVSKSGEADYTIAYSSGSAPVNAGTYQVTMAVDGGTAENSTITRDLVISPATIDSVTFDPASQNYDGSAKSTTMTVKAGALTLNKDEYAITGGVTGGVVGSPAQDTATTVSVVSNSGNFQGGASGVWTVKAPSGSFAADALTTSAAGCSKTAENVISVTDSSQLAYVGENLWRVLATITWPRHFPSNSASQGDKDVQYIDEDHAIINVSRGETALDIQTKDYKVLGAVVFSHDYINTLTWSVDIPLDEFKQAIEAGKTELVYDIELGALGWTHYESGIRGTTYQIRVPIDDKLILNDADGRRVYPPHQHDWSLLMADETQIAVECSDPDCPQRALMLSLVADSWIYNGTTYSAELKGADDFRVHVGAEVGEVTYWAGETQLKSPPKYTGDYEARVAATVLGKSYVLTQQFSICKPYDGYTDGWELAKQGVAESMWVRYDTCIEATANADDGDTVIYHSGYNGKDRQLYVTSDHDVTIDLNGKTLERNVNGDMEICNNGSGVVTLVNGTIKEPSNGLLEGADLAFIGTKGNRGSFVFGAGLTLENVTTLSSIELNVRVEGTELEIRGGQYQIDGFLVGDGGSVSVKGGKFWSDFNPSAHVAPGYVVREISGDYKYEVVETAEVVKEYVVGVTGGDPSEVAKWLSEKVSDLTAVMSCEYLKASFELDVGLITDATTIDITDFSVSGGIAFTITITLDKNAPPVVIKAPAEKLASRIRVADAPDMEFAAIDSTRLTVDVETGRATVALKPGAASEFLKILIERDNAQ